MPKKLYCYVDETGQDTTGNLFIVSVVIIGNEQDYCRGLCERIEVESGKGKAKWIKAGYNQKLDYITRVLYEPYFAGKLFYATHRNTVEYQDATVRTIGGGLACFAKEDYKATVFIDALPKKVEQQVGLGLRRLGANVKKVRGPKKDEHEPIIRLADTLCGLARSTYDGKADMQELLDWAIRTGVITDLS